MKKLLFVSMLLLVIINGCTNEKNKVTLATSKNMWCSLSLIAIEKNFFSEEGLDVNVNYQEAGRFCMDALLSKSADFANVVDVNIGYVAFTPNKNINVVCEISGALTSAIIAKKSRGINSPADLKGKNLAFSPGTTSDVFATRFLEKYEIPKALIQLTKLQPKAMVSSMIAKDGPDAASTWQPFISNIEKQLGADAIVFEVPDIYTAREYVAVRNDWAKAHPAITEAFLKALKKADDFVKTNKDEAQQIVAKATGLDLQLVKATWEKYQIRFAFDEKKYLAEITQIGFDISKQEEYTGKSIPDYTQFFNGSYFKSINK